jgi:hypothetical protein
LRFWIVGKCLDWIELRLADDNLDTNLLVSVIYVLDLRSWVCLGLDYI